MEEKLLLRRGGDPLTVARIRETQGTSSYPRHSVWSLAGFNSSCRGLACKDGSRRWKCFLKQPFAVIYNTTAITKLYFCQWLPNWFE